MSKSRDNDIMIGGLSTMQRLKLARDLAESPPTVDGLSDAEARGDVEDEYRPLMDGEGGEAEADDLDRLDKGDTVERRTTEVGLSYGSFLVLGNPATHPLCRFFARSDIGLARGGHPLTVELAHCRDSLSEVPSDRLSLYRLSFVLGHARLHLFQSRLPRARQLHTTTI
jgi:hypothetical protein